jgi:hypothetical protein
MIDIFVPSGSGGLDGADYLVFGPDRNLYVASQRTQSVLRFNGTTGEFMDVFASGGGLLTPKGLVFVVPEPSTWMLFGLGIVAFACKRRAKRNLAEKYGGRGMCEEPRGPALFAGSGDGGKASAFKQLVNGTGIDSE